MKFQRRVISGTQTGRTLGFPTLNFEPADFGEHYEQGVYSSFIEIDDAEYKAALYFGPKKDHEGNTLELFIIDFDGQLYGQNVEFEIIEKIRSPKSFSNLEDLKKQIEMDIDSIV